MATKGNRPASEVLAFSLLGFARQYEESANLIFDSGKPLDTPMCFLYLRAIEFALTAFRQTTTHSSEFRGRRGIYPITAMYQECGLLGLRFDPHQMRDFAGVIIS